MKILLYAILIVNFSIFSADSTHQDANRERMERIGQETPEQEYAALRRLFNHSRSTMAPDLLLCLQQFETLYLKITDLKNNCAYIELEDMETLKTAKKFTPFAIGYVKAKSRKLENIKAGDGLIVSIIKGSPGELETSLFEEYRIVTRESINAARRINHAHLNFRQYATLKP